MIYSDLKDREAYRLLFPNYSDVVNIPQFCEMLGGISRKTAYKLMRDNKIAHLKVGRAIKYPSVMSSHTCKNAVCRKRKGMFHLKAKDRSGKIEVSIS